MSRRRYEGSQDKRHALVQELAPLAPPCFSSRLTWLQYLLSADEARDGAALGPIVLEAGQPARFNLAFNFCADCDACWRDEQRVVERGVCRPDWLRQFVVVAEPA